MWKGKPLLPVLFVTDNKIYNIKLFQKGEEYKENNKKGAGEEKYKDKILEIRRGTLSISARNTVRVREKKMENKEVRKMTTWCLKCVCTHYVHCISNFI